MFLIGQLGRGGAERQLCLLAAGLKEAGHDVRVVSVRGGQRLKELQEADVDVHLLIPDEIGAPSASGAPPPEVDAERTTGKLAKPLLASLTLQGPVTAPHEGATDGPCMVRPEGGWGETANPDASPLAVPRLEALRCIGRRLFRLVRRGARICRRVALRLLRLARRGVRLVRRGIRRWRSRLRRLLRERRRQIRRRLSDLIWLRRYTGDFESQLRDFRPDVVHAFLPSTSILAAWVAPRCQVPVVVVGRRSLGWYRVERPLLGILEMLLTRRASCVVTNTSTVAEEVAGRREISANRIHVIPNALPDYWLDVPQRQCESNGSSQLRFVTVANFRHVKGYDVAYRAFELLASEGWHFSWLAVGGGPERDDFAALAAGEPWFQVGEASSDRAVMEHLDQSDVFVLPSRSEGMSNSLMEAMARGLACVATDVGGNRELVANDGLIVPSESPAALARAIGELLASPELVATYQMRARRSAQRFALRNMVLEHERLYAKYDSRPRSSMRSGNRGTV